MAKEPGHLGFFVNQVPVFYFEQSRPTARPRLNMSLLTSTKTLPRVDIVYAHIDSSPDLVDASIESGARGIVFAGTGAGNVPEGVESRAHLWSLKNGVPMVFSTRTMNGFVPAFLNGSEWKIAAADLNPQKARILLQLALLDELAPNNVPTLFARLQPHSSA